MYKQLIHDQLSAFILWVSFAHNGISIRQRKWQPVGSKNNTVTITQSWQPLSCFQDSCSDREALQTRVSGSGGYLCVCVVVCVCVCVCVTWAAMPDGASVTWTPPILVKMPPHGLVWATANPTRRKKPVCHRSAPITNLPWHPEDLRPSKYGDYSLVPGGAEAEPFIGVRCLLTVCVSICWCAEQTQLGSSVPGHTGCLAQTAIIWRYPAVLWKFRE